MVAVKGASSPPLDLDREAAQFVDRVVKLAEARQRPELAEQVRAAGREADSGTATLVVAGEAKRGKSSLVNALLGQPDLSPVDVDVATNTYISLHFASPEFIRVHRDGIEAPEEVTREEIAHFASVRGNPSNLKGVRMVEVGLDHPLLEQGLTIIDTPGVGGLEAEHARVTKEALKTADALLFVLDAHAPLSGPELTFLNDITEGLGMVVFALTKRDAYRGWETILRDDKALLAEHAPRYANDPFFPLSSKLKLEADSAAAAGDHEFAQELYGESGFHELESELVRSMVGKAKALRALNKLASAGTILKKLEKLDRDAFQAASADPKLKAAKDEANRRKNEFVNSKSKSVGSVKLSDEFQTLSEDLTGELARSLLDLSQRFDSTIGAKELKPEALPQEFHMALTAIVARLNRMLHERVLEIGSRLALELEIALEVRDVDELAMPERRASASEPTRPTGKLDSVMNLLPAVYASNMPRMAIGSLAPALGISAAVPVLMPFAAVAGIAFMGLQILRQRKIRDQQEALRRFRRAIEQTKTELPPSLNRKVRELRRAVESDFLVAITEREAELDAAVAEQDELANKDRTTQLQARDVAKKRLQEILRAKKEADDLRDRLTGGGGL